jgi:hypothetical protein
LLEEKGIYGGRTFPAGGGVAFRIARVGDQDDSNYYEMAVQSTDVHPNGSLIVSSGSGWSAVTGKDAYFKIEFAYSDSEWLEATLPTSQAPTYWLLYGGTDLAGASVSLYKEQTISGNSFYDLVDTEVITSSGNSIYPIPDDERGGGYSNNSTKWLILFTGITSQQPGLDLWYLGPVTEMPHYMENSSSFHPTRKTTEQTNLKANQGAFVGKLKPWAVHDWQINFATILPDWWAAHGDAFQDAEVFLFAWNSGDYPNDLFKAWFKSDIEVAFTDGDMVALGFPMQAESA